MTRILLRITSDLPSPAPQSTGFKNIQFSGYFVFFPTPFGSREVFSLPPALAITVYTYCRSYCSASAIHLTLLSQQQYSLAPGSLTKFFNLLNQQHYLIAPGLLYVFSLKSYSPDFQFETISLSDHEPTALPDSCWFFSLI